MARRYRSIFTIAGLVIILVLSSLHVFGGETQPARSPPAPRALRSNPQLRLTLETNRSTYLLGEPLVLDVSLTNVGDETVHVVRWLDPTYKFLVFQVTRPSGEEERFGPVVSACGRLDPFVKLPPGESVYGHAKVFYGAPGWFFNQPGVYTIQALYPGPVERAEEMVISNQLQVEFVDEEPGASKLIMGGEQGLFLLWEHGDHLTRGIGNLQELIDRYPDSILAAYGNYALGVNLSKEFYDALTDEIRAPRPEESIEYLERTLEWKEELNPYFVINTYLLLPREYGLLEMYDPAIDHLDDFQTYIETFAPYPLYPMYQPLILETTDLRRILMERK